MDVFEDVDNDIKLKIVQKWKKMNDTDKTHFINQVSLALSVWGSDDKGKKFVVNILTEMVSNGSNTLADFGLYVDRLIEKRLTTERLEKIKRVSLILEGYRIKNALPSEPSKEIEL